MSIISKYSLALIAAASTFNPVSAGIAFEQIEDDDYCDDDYCDDDYQYDDYQDTTGDKLSDVVNSYCDGNFDEVASPYG